MLLVRTKLKSSSIHGLGLFADQFIPQGTPTWKYLEGFDFRVPAAMLERLSPIAREQFLTYTYLRPALGVYELCSDDARFFNHADDPNTKCVDLPNGDAHDVATRDIQPGEELTCDYRTFDPDWKIKLGRS